VVSDTGALTILKAGTAVITAAKAGDDAYNAASAILTLTVDKLTLTGTAAAVNRDYDGGTAVAVSITATNTVGSDDVRITAAGTADNADAGTGKTVAISGIGLSGADAGNYNAPASIANTTVTITPAAITGVSAITALDAPATGAGPDTTATVAETGISTTAGIAWKKADDTAFTGNYAPLTSYKAAITLTADANHTFTAATTIPAAVSGAAPADKTVTGAGAANSLTFTVTFPATTGGTVPTGKIITAWITGHDIGASASAAAITRTAGTDIPAGHITITVTGAGYGAAYVWTVNDVTDTAQTGASFDFDATWRSNGTYTIGLAATKDGIQYSKTFTVTVGN
jgi:hypothetical protein